MHQLTTLSTEELAWRVTARTFTGAKQDLSGMTVKVAFTATGVKPVDDPNNNTVWHTCTWLAPGVAGIIVGPGGIDLDAGTYDEHLWVVSSPLRPHRLAGQLTIT